MVSQSIMKLIVPVGASTVACALRYPFASPCASASSHAPRAPRIMSSGTSAASMLATAARCLRITRSMASALRGYSVNGPIRPAISADLRYARPVIMAVMAAAYARPSSES